jgi:hypothetical protein
VARWPLDDFVVVADDFLQRCLRQPAGVSKASRQSLRALELLRYV